jgi:cysteinyl-tRNA synthetase
MEFSLDGLKIAQVAFDKLRKIVGDLPDGGKTDENYQNNFKELISNDLAMPEVIALIWKLTKDENVKLEDKKATLLDFDRVLDLDLDKKVMEEEIPDDIKELSKERTEAKANKDWAKADELRDLIKQKGYILEDGKDGVKIHKI